MVSRKHNLEVLYTNGLIFWTEKVKDSFVPNPYTIQDIIQNQKNKTVIACCSIQGNDTDCFIKVFTYDSKNNKFHYQKRPLEGISKNNLKNITLNSEGDLVSMNVELLQTKVNKDFFRENISCAKMGSVFQITLPKSLILKELMNQDNELERFVQSGDGRLLMCDRIIIQMNKDQTEVMDVGCIVYERDHSIINYNFLSLLNFQQRDKIHKLLKKPMTLNYIVKIDFDNVPIFSPFFQDTIYFVNHLDAIDNCAQNGTSIIKMSTNSLKCLEIYQSKFKIIHFSINESKQISQQKTNLVSQTTTRKDSIMIKVKDRSELKKKVEELRNAVDSSDSLKTSKMLEESGELIEFDDNQIKMGDTTSPDQTLQNKNVQNTKVQSLDKDESSSGQSGASIKINQNDFMYDVHKAETINNPNSTNTLTLQKPTLTLQKPEPENPSVTSKLMGSLSFKKQPKKQDPVDPQRLFKIMTTTNQFKKGLHKLIDEEIDMNTNLLSLVSQSKNQINVEIIQDDNLLSKDLHTVQGQIKKSFTLMSVVSDNEEKESKEKRDQMKLRRAKLFYYVSILSKKEFFITSEVGWISNTSLILTLNNQYYLMNLNHADLCKVKNNIYYGKQQVNMGLFVSIVSCQHNPPQTQTKKIEKNKKGDSVTRKTSFHTKSEIVAQAQNIKRSEGNQINQENGNKASEGANTVSQIKLKQEMEAEIKKRDQLYRAQECIQKMAIASLVRYSFILHSNHSHNQQGFNKLLYFFIPCEELNGSSIFTKLSANYNVIQKYVEKIDAPFIEYLNQEIRSINYFIVKYTSQNKYIANQYLSNLQQQHTDQVDKGQDHKGLHPTSLSHSLSVHMYQDDISGISAIDNAFQKNSIFSIKAFVDSLLNLKEDKQFRNCFDQALLKMIRKGMNVKELCSSGLLYPKIWENYTLFSAIETPVVVGYNNDLEDLEFDDPSKIFNSQLDKKFKQVFDRNMVNKAQKKLQRRRSKLRKMTLSEEEVQRLDEEEQQMIRNQEQEIREQYEMQYNYIYMRQIQTENKIQFTKTLKDNEDLELFEIEAIQIIIDYKWNKYAKNFFLLKFFVYLSFLITYVSDLETLNITQPDSELRSKDELFYLRKAWCCSVQFFFFIYELLQFKKEGKEYLSDFWNYFELIGIFFFYTATSMDILYDTVSDNCRIIYCCSMMMTLIKILFLIRVFKSLSFLTMMIIQVVIELIPFTVLFLIFILTFSECYQIVQTDISAYGRLPQLWAHFLSTMRSAFGDFSLIDPKQGFDLHHEDYDPEIHDEIKYRHSTSIVYFTFIIYMLCNFSLFMIFMNFIIAVISDSYDKVRNFALAHDYKQRVLMIYEREIHFTEDHLENEAYFPNILIVRKKKIPMVDELANSQGQMKFIKNSLKEFQQQNQSQLDSKIKEQKEHLSSSLQFLEHDIHQVSKDMQKIFLQMDKISKQGISRLPKQPNQSKHGKKIDIQNTSVQTSTRNAIQKLIQTDELQTNEIKQENAADNGRQGEVFPDDALISSKVPRRTGLNKSLTKKKFKKKRINSAESFNSFDSGVSDDDNGYCTKEGSLNASPKKLENFNTQQTDEEDFEQNLQKRRQRVATVKSLSQSQSRNLEEQVRTMNMQFGDMKKENSKNFQNMRKESDNNFKQLKKENENLKSQIQQILDIQLQMSQKQIQNARQQNSQNLNSDLESNAPNDATGNTQSVLVPTPMNSMTDMRYQQRPTSPQYSVPELKDFSKQSYPKGPASRNFRAELRASNESIPTIQEDRSRSNQ